MKLTPKIKKQIDDYFDKITPEDLITKLEEYGWEFEYIDDSKNETMSNKPTIKTIIIEYLSWIECREYIREKYNVADNMICRFWTYIIEWNAGDINATFNISERPENELLSEVWDLFNNEFDLSTATFMNR